MPVPVEVVAEIQWAKFLKYSCIDGLLVMSVIRPTLDQLNKGVDAIRICTNGVTGMTPLIALPFLRMLTSEGYDKHTASFFWQQQQQGCELTPHLTLFPLISKIIIICDETNMINETCVKVVKKYRKWNKCVGRRGRPGSLGHPARMVLTPASSSVKTRLYGALQTSDRYSGSLETSVGSSSPSTPLLTPPCPPLPLHSRRSRSPLKTPGARGRVCVRCPVSRPS